jgi:uncharacterized protein YodC (DUF2158 family)
VSKKKKVSDAFAEGSIVSLNIPDAPTMIVHAVEGAHVICDWFDGKSLCRKPFHEKQLVSAQTVASNRDVARAILDILRSSEGLRELDLAPKALDEVPKNKAEPAKGDAQE